MPPPHMLTFHFVNNSKYHCQIFLSVLTDLQGNAEHVALWHCPGNLGHTLQRAATLNEACANIFITITKRTADYKPPPDINSSDTNYTRNPDIGKFKKELLHATVKKRNVR